MELMKVSQKAIHDVLAVAKRMESRGLVDAYSGNISVREGDLVYVTPSGKHKAFLTEEMISIVDMDGNWVGGTCGPSSEVKLHLHCYKVRPDVHGVVHAHCPYMTAYAICNTTIETKAYPEMMILFDKIEVAPYGRPGTDDIYTHVGPLLQKGDVCLLENHGAVCVGPDVWEAMAYMEVAESSTRVLTLTKQIGKQADLPEDECQWCYDSHVARHQARMGK